MLETIEQLLLDRLPGVAGVMSGYSDRTLQDYTAGFNSPPVQSIQPRDDFVQLAGAYAGDLLGEPVGRQLQEQLSASPTVLTANHHGVDYRPLTVQGTIIFALPALLHEIPVQLRVVPVLACGTIPLDNSTFPMGISLAQPLETTDGSAGTDARTTRIKIFPWKYSRQMISVSPPYTGKMVHEALKLAEDLRNSEVLDEPVFNVIKTVLLEDYLDQRVLELPEYSEQAVVLNGKLWRRIVAGTGGQQPPELVYLEMERLAAELIRLDLSNRDSLLYSLLFDHRLRERLVDAMDRQDGCWDTGQLQSLLRDTGSRKMRSQEFRGCGSMFFWGVDSRGHRVPLLLENRSGKPVLEGISRVDNISIPMDPDSLLVALDERRILPSLFTCFTVLAFARGIKCYGGIYQATYLPAMEVKLSQTLRSHGLNEWAELVDGVPTTNFVTGLQAVFSDYGDGRVAMSGAVELIAAGGLDTGHFRRIGQLTVQEANRCGMLDGYSDLLNGSDRATDGADNYMREIIELLGRRATRVSLINGYAAPSTTVASDT